MPRIEIIPENWKQSAACRAGDGTPTIDVCKSCAADYEEGEQYGDGGMIGGTDVAHPCYGELADFGDPYCCTDCGDQLGEEDN